MFQCFQMKGPFPAILHSRLKTLEQPIHHTPFIEFHEPTINTSDSHILKMAAISLYLQR